MAKYVRETEYYEAGYFVKEYYMINGINEGLYILKHYREEKYYYEFTETIIRNYIHGQIQGPSITLNRDGQIKEITNFVDDYLEGEFHDYYSNGKIMETGYFSYNKKVGENKKYHENGALCLIRHYKNDKLNGDCKEYDELGNIIKHVIFNNGKIIKRII